MRESLIQLAQVLISTEVTLVLCFLILVLGLGAYLYLLRRPIGRLRRDLDVATEAVLKTRNSRDLALHFEEVHAVLQSLETLGPSWQSFRRSLFFAPAPGESEPVGHAPVAPGQHFTTGDLLDIVADSRMLSLIPNILIGLGIWGTFLGLAGGVFLASMGLASSDITQVKASLGALLSGASLAFWKSICGLGGSLAFTFVERRAVRGLSYRVDKFVQALDRRLVSVPTELVLSEHLHHAKETNALLRSLPDDLASKIAAAMDQRLEARLPLALGPSIDRFEAVGREILTANQAVIRDTLTEWKTFIGGGARVELKALVKSLGRFRADLEVVASTLDMGRQRFEFSTQALGGNLDRAMTAVRKGLEESVGAAGDALRSAAKDASRELSTQCEASGRSLAASVHDVHRIVTEMITAEMSSFREAMGQVNRSLLETRGYTDTWKTDFTRAVGDVRTELSACLKVAQDESRARLQDAASSLTRTLEETGGELRDRAQGVLEDLKAAAVLPAPAPVTPMEPDPVVRDLELSILALTQKVHELIFLIEEVRARPAGPLGVMAGTAPLRSPSLHGGA